MRPCSPMLDSEIANKNLTAMTALNTLDSRLSRVIKFPVYLEVKRHSHKIVLMSQNKEPCLKYGAEAQPFDPLKHDWNNSEAKIQQPSNDLILRVNVGMKVNALMEQNEKLSTTLMSLSVKLGQQTKAYSETSIPKTSHHHSNSKSLDEDTLAILLDRIVEAQEAPTPINWAIVASSVSHIISALCAFGNLAMALRTFLKKSPIIKDRVDALEIKVTNPGNSASATSMSIEGIQTRVDELEPKFDQMEDDDIKNTMDVKIEGLHNRAKRQRMR
ncbi:hypothetical protein LX36DRAFT_668466 [Colletotrichum falcatum]|nr:hypothetical protein LX36DRAFT_668466 [Colletotrichum falcatum]